MAGLAEIKLPLEGTKSSLRNHASPTITSVLPTLGDIERRARETTQK